MKKVLLLCYYFPPMGMGGTQRSAKFVKYLPQFDWDPVVITVKDVHYYAHDRSLLDEIDDRKVIRTDSFDPLRLINNISKTTSPDKKPDNTSTQKRTSKFLNLMNQLIGAWLFVPDSKMLWLPFAVKKSLSIIQKHKISVIYTTSPPHSAHIGGLLLRLVTGVKWVADFRDEWTGGESQPSPSIFHTFFNRLMEKFVLKSADRVIGMCGHLTNNLKRKHGYLARNKKFSTIMNGYDREDFSGLIGLSLNSCFTITHCGSISRVSDPEPFLKAIQLLLKRNPELQRQMTIQFFGTDIYGRLASLVNDLELNQVISPIRYLPHRDVTTELMRSHLLLLTIFKKTREEIITGKVFEYLASGKPILLISSNGEVARMIHSFNRGVVVDNHDIQGIYEAIFNYFEKFQLGETKFNDPLSLPQFDRENLTGKLAKIFSDLLVRV